MDRRQFLGRSLGGLAATGTRAVPAGAGPRRPAEGDRGAGGETLYNGIRLPAHWPPRLGGVPREPAPPHYLPPPPTVIPIDVGRQLFVDDFLVAETTLRRTFHAAKYHASSPVLKPDQEWEKEGGPMAMVFSDGVWYDPKDRLFKMWYMGGQTRSTCHATS